MDHNHDNLIHGDTYDTESMALTEEVHSFSMHQRSSSALVLTCAVDSAVQLSPAHV